MNSAVEFHSFCSDWIKISSFESSHEHLYVAEVPKIFRISYNFFEYILHIALELSKMFLNFLNFTNILRIAPKPQEKFRRPTTVSVYRTPKNQYPIDGDPYYQNDYNVAIPFSCSTLLEEFLRRLLFRPSYGDFSTNLTKISFSQILLHYKP